MRAALAPLRARLLAFGALSALPATTRPALAAQAPPEGARPNIVVFVGDDLGWRDTGPYGNAAVRTPTIDRLARSGLTVERAFGTTPQHDCDEHQRAVRTRRYKLIRTDAYTALPLCTAADVGASPSFLALRARAKAGRLTAAQRRLFEAPRARIELYDLASDPWELDNIADDPAHGKQTRELAAVLQKWIEQSDDFPAAYRVRDDNTDRVTGVPFTIKIPALREPDVPPPAERWGRARVSGYDRVKREGVK